MCYLAIKNSWLGVQPIEIIVIFASAKGAERGRSITIGEKGIRWKAETIPVAVSPILVGGCVRSRTQTERMNVGRTLCHWSIEIGKARQRTSQKTCLCFTDLLPAGIWVVITLFLLQTFFCSELRSGGFVPLLLSYRLWCNNHIVYILTIFLNLPRTCMLLVLFG